PTNGKGQLVFFYQDNRPAQPRIKEDLFNLGRLKRIGNQHLQRIVPADDINPLAAQLIDNVLDPAAAHPHAGTHAIDFQVDTGGGDLAPVASLAGQGLDFNGAVGNFGDLIFKQPPNEIGVGAREDDLDSMTNLADLQYYRLDPLADMMGFAGNL